MQATAEKRVAYDLSRFDRRSIVKEQVERENTDARARRHAKARTKARPAISGFSVFSSVVVFVMLITMLFSYVNINEASDRSRKKKEMLEDLLEQNQMLEISCNQRMGARQIQEWAVTRLGMNKTDKAQVVYVTTSDGDRFEIAEKAQEEQPKLVAGIAKGFSRIIEYIN